MLMSCLKGRDDSKFIVMACDECGKSILQARRLAMPSVQFCIACQSELEKQHHGHNAGTAD